MSQAIINSFNTEFVQIMQPKCRLINVYYTIHVLEATGHRTKNTSKNVTHTDQNSPQYKTLAFKIIKPIAFAY